MAPIGKILQVQPLDKSRYRYILRLEDDSLYVFDLEKREHIYVIETMGDIVGRRVIYNEEDLTFKFLKE